MHVTLEYHLAVFCLIAADEHVANALMTLSTFPPDDSLHEQIEALEEMQRQISEQLKNFPTKKNLLGEVH